MSRIGRQPIEIPEGARVELDSSQILVSGPRGSQIIELKPQISLDFRDSKVYVKRKNNTKAAKSLHGLIRTLIYNMLVGVTVGWEKVLEVVGTGFGVKLEGNKLILKLGFSHPVEFISPEGIAISVTENKIKITGVNKAKVGEIAAKIRQLAPPNAYSGKGIRYLDEKLRLKPGKSAKAVGGSKT